MTTQIDAQAIGDRDLVLARIIDAPREKVCAACTTPAKVALWWALRPWTASVLRMDLRRAEPLIL